MMASIAEAKPFKRSYSGWIVATEIDTNGDGRRADSVTTTEKGTFGRATANWQGELEPNPSGTCDNNPGIFKFDYVAVTGIEIYHKGDGMAWGLDQGTLCSNPLFGTFTFEVHLVLLGGTGRFEGATGSAILSGEGVGLAGEPGVRATHQAVGGAIEGEIFLAP